MNIGQKITDGTCMWVLRHKGEMHNVGDIWMYNGAFNANGFPIHKLTGLAMLDCHLCDGTNGTVDLRNKFVMGSDAAGIGATGGANNTTLTVAQMPTHGHSGAAGAAGGHTHTASSTTGAGGGHGHTATGTASATGADDHTHSLTLMGQAGEGRGDTTANCGWGSDYPTGRSFTKTTTAANSSHGHTVTMSVTAAPNHQHSMSLTTSDAGAHNHTITTANAGGGQAFDNRPAYTALTYVQKIY